MAAAAAAPCVRAAEAPLKTVKSRKTARDPWKEYPVRTVDDLPGFQPAAKAPALTRYGGVVEPGLRQGGTGFFRPMRLNDRWYFTDPDGKRCIQPAVTTVTPGSSDKLRAALQDKYGDPARWAAETVKQLRGYGFVATGAWSNAPLLNAAPDRLPWYTTLSFIATFGKEKKLTVRQPGHTGFVNDAMPLFHPEFEPFCDKYASQLAATKDDPFLVGHFSDNETPASLESLPKFLALQADDPNRKATVAWLQTRKGTQAEPTTADLTAEDKDAFRGFLYERYLSVTTKAIRRHDPNHLCLGPRLWGPSVRSAGILQACGRHLDVIAVNLYNQWTPDPTMVELWRKEANKPWIITEYYVKGEDSGLPNTTGAGWLVPTQADRGLFYQNFTLALLETRDCIGWQWFKYQDNDPSDPKAELSNLDSNKGLYDIRYEVYAPLAAHMKAVNSQVYPLIDYFDRRRSA